MRKKISIIIIAAALLLTACSNSDNNTDNTAQSPTTTSSIQDNVSVENEPNAEATQENTSNESVFTAFKPGIWEGDKQYYIFNEDLQSGKVRSFLFGEDVGFNFYLSGENEIVFNFAFDGDNSPAKITDSSDDSVTLEWSDGTTETLKFITSENEESFNFPEIAAKAFTSFKPGIWKGRDGYFYFNEDKKSGVKKDFSLENTNSFAYEINKNILTFLFETTNSSITAEILLAEENSVTLDREDGETEVLTFIYEGDFENFIPDSD